MSDKKITKASIEIKETMPNRQEFLQTLDLYLAEMEEDACFEQARQYYASGSGSRVLRLDRWGSPAKQLRADARAGEYLKETAQAIQRAPILVWHPGMEMPKGRFKPDRFTEAAAQLIEAFDALPAETVVVTLEEGVRQGLKAEQRQLVEEWRRAYQVELKKYRAECLRTGVKGYKEISLFTFVGFAGGLGLGALLDTLGFSASAIGEWAVRTISGEGEDLSEGAWVLKNQLRRKKGEAPKEAPEEHDEEGLYEEGLVWFEGEDETEAAEAYGTGKVVGMAAPWAIDAISRLAGVDVRAPEGSYVAYFYSLADQLFASINGLRYHIRRAGSFWAGVKAYFRDPVMATSFTIVTLPFLALYLIRSAGWRPNSLFLAAFEGVLLNLCWVPPMAAWVWDGRLQRGLRRTTQAYAAKARTI